MENGEREPEAQRVVAGVLISDDEILVGWRKDTGKCEFPGGKVEPGEDLDAALIRELDEELGAAIIPGKHLNISRHNYGGDIGLVQVHFIEFKPDGNLVLRRDKYEEVYDEVKFVKITKAPELDWLEADRQFVRDLAVAATSSRPSSN